MLFVFQQSILPVPSCAFLSNGLRAVQGKLYLRRAEKTGGKASIPISQGSCHTLSVYRGKLCGSKREDCVLASNPNVIDNPNQKAISSPKFSRCVYTLTVGFSSLSFHLTCTSKAVFLETKMWLNWNKSLATLTSYFLTKLCFSKWYMSYHKFTEPEILI